MSENASGAIYELADVYEDVYRGRGKDYGTEAGRVIDQVRAHNPGARSLLDVACGTGSHLKYFAKAFSHVEGLDLSADMLGIARSNLPGVPLHQGDMREFRLDREFDVITCLFSSISYLTTAGELKQALRGFAGHVPMGGVIALEPWWFPETFTPGHVGGDVVTVPGRKIARMSHSSLAGRASRVEVRYVVASAETGIRDFTEVHLLTLFDRAEYEAAFTEAGCSVRYIANHGGPGLFIGVRTSDAR